MARGTYDLGYTPGRTAVGESTFDPGAVASGLGGGIDIMDMLYKLKRMQPKEKTERAAPVRRPMQSEVQPAGARIGGPFQLMDRLQGMRQDFYGQRIGSNPRFSEMIPAFTASGVDLFGGKPTGWEMYAQLAGAAPPADSSAGPRNQSLQAQTQGLQQANQGAMAARMYPGMFTRLYGQQEG